MQGVLYKACLRLFVNQLLNALCEFFIYSDVYKNKCLVDKVLNSSQTMI